MTVTALRPEQVSFEDFWKACARKVGKPIAKAKFDAITSGQGLKTRTRDKDSGEYVDIHLQATPEELVEGMKRFVRNWPQNPDFSLKDPQYIPHPATWLNQGRWLDE